MPESLLKRTLVYFSTLVAGLAALVEILAFFNVIIPFPEFLGFLFSIISLFWGIAERNNSKSLVRAIARSSIPVASFAILYFGLTVYILHIDGERPGAIGFIIGKTKDGLHLTMHNPPDQVSGEYQFNFDRTADLARAIFAPTDKHAQRVQRLTIRPILGDIEKVVRPAPEDGALVKNPSASLKASVSVSAKLQSGSNTDPVDVFILIEYGQQTCWWRVKRWVFQRYG